MPRVYRIHSADVARTSWRTRPTALSAGHWPLPDRRRVLRPDVAIEQRGWRGKTLNDPIIPVVVVWQPPVSDAGRAGDTLPFDELPLSNAHPLEHHPRPPPSAGRYAEQVSHDRMTSGAMT
jgi:hypothetical protein